jgi:hypothetical protein
MSQPPTPATFWKLRKWAEKNGAEIRFLPRKKGFSPALEIFHDGDGPNAGTRFRTVMFYGKYASHPRRWGWGSTFPVDFMARAVRAFAEGEK